MAKKIPKNKLVMIYDCKITLIKVSLVVSLCLRFDATTGSWKEHANYLEKN